MRVAKSPYDIYANPANLSLDTNYDSLMIIYDNNILGSATEYTHNLGYLPATIEFFNYGTQWFPMESPVFNTADAWVGVDSPGIEYDVNKAYISNFDTLPIKLLVTGNSADNQTGSGKNTAVGKFKVSKPGLSVPSITDVRQFRFCSGLDTVKKDETLSSSTSIANPTGIFKKVEITHNLGYVPMVSARLTSNDYDVSYNGAILPINMALFDFTPVSYYITTTKLVFFTEGMVGNFNINYNIYRNKLN